MKNVKLISIFVVVFGLAAFLVYSELKPVNSEVTHSEDKNAIFEIQGTPATINDNSTAPVGQHGASAALDENAPSQMLLKLNLGNFENFVGRCFQGEPCTLEENPLAMYQAYKKTENHKANDLLISFLRSKIRDPAWAAYKGPLKEMIDDFYPREEKQFQEAAFYNYAGDLEKSLELYLDLEKKSELDSTLRRAPPLNIANTYFDLGRLSEALPYYEAALTELVNAKEKSDQHTETLRFIEERIQQIRSGKTKGSSFDEPLFALHAQKESAMF